MCSENCPHVGQRLFILVSVALYCNANLNNYYYHHHFIGRGLKWFNTTMKSVFLEQKAPLWQS